MSVHTDVNMVYDASANTFLPGNNVAFTDQATQCLTSFSLDFERQSANTTDGPNMTVHSVLVNGAPATFTFEQPTRRIPIRWRTRRRRTTRSAALAVTRCRLRARLSCRTVASARIRWTAPSARRTSYITPRAPTKDNSTFTVVVNYTGRPGVHNDGDGTTEGWFRATDGSFVTTEPVGTEDWMPLNDYPTAKPTYDFYDTINAGKTTVANGDLVSVTQTAPDANFPAGSTTYRWHSAAPIASYLVEDSVGNYTFSTRLGSDGITYEEAQDSAIGPAQQASNKAVMDQQQDITDFESQFNGPSRLTLTALWSALRRPASRRRCRQ
jgi:hypothetical protein